MQKPKWAVILTILQEKYVILHTTAFFHQEVSYEHSSLI